MPVVSIRAQEVLTRWADFPAVVDARSEGEYALDHLPGAINWPSLRDDERALVGTIYRQTSPFEARKRGAALVAANIARHIERDVLDKSRQWQPLVYCWRGGQRSGALALVLGQIGFRVHLIEGGYKAFRAALLADLPRLVGALRLKVVCGPTGSGKTRLLQALAAAGAQVLDLEALASHRSSVLGAIPGQAQPCQKRFETLIWDVLRQFDAARPVYVESESRKVGNLAVPDPLIAAMRGSPSCVELQLAFDERVRLLLEDYRFFAEDADLFCNRLEALTELRGKLLVQEWKDAVRAGRVEDTVRGLLLQHYDPGYARSTERSFTAFTRALRIEARDRTPAAMAEVARQLIDQD